jgi:hypothetical protein
MKTQKLSNAAALAVTQHVMLLGRGFKGRQNRETCPTDDTG